MLQACRASVVPCNAGLCAKTCTSAASSGPSCQVTFASLQPGSTPIVTIDVAHTDFGAPNKYVSNVTIGSHAVGTIDLQGNIMGAGDGVNDCDRMSKIMDAVVSPAGAVSATGELVVGIETSSSVGTYTCFGSTLFARVTVSSMEAHMLGGVEDGKTHGSLNMPVSMPRRSSDTVVPIGRRTSKTPASATVSCSGSCACSPSSGMSSGTISDGPGDYSNGESCYWVIASSGGSGANNEIRLSFPSFETGSYGGDYVRIYSCSFSSSPESCSSSTLIATLSGSSVSASEASRKYTSTTGYMQVKFTSDSSYTYSGFVGRWEVGCAAGSFASSGSASCRPCNASAGYYCPVGSTSAAGIACEAGYHCPGGANETVKCGAVIPNFMASQIPRWIGIGFSIFLGLLCLVAGGQASVIAAIRCRRKTRDPHCDTHPNRDSNVTSQHADENDQTSCRRVQAVLSSYKRRMVQVNGQHQVDPESARKMFAVNPENILCTADGRDDHDNTTSGLKWKKIGDTKPSSGRELLHTKLSECLEHKTTFTHQEWVTFGIHGLRVDHYIRSGSAYFKPSEMILMLKAGRKATDNELCLMDAGFLGIRASQIPRRAFLGRWAQVSRLRNSFMQHLVDSDETSSWFANPELCENSGYSRRERSAIMIHVLLTALASQQITAMGFNDPCSNNIAHTVGMKVLELFTTVALHEILKVVAFTPLIKMVFKWDNSKGTSCERMLKWAATLVCAVLWLCGACTLIAVTILNAKEGWNPIIWLATFFLSPFLTWMRNYLFMVPLYFFVVSKWAEVHPATDPPTYAAKSLSILPRSIWKSLMTLALGMDATWGASDGLNGYPFLEAPAVNARRERHLQAERDNDHECFFTPCLCVDDHPRSLLANFWRHIRGDVGQLHPDKQERYCGLMSIFFFMSGFLCIMVCPVDVREKQMLTLEEGGWEACTDQRGRRYYQNHTTKLTQWENPDSAPAPMQPKTTQSVTTQNYCGPITWLICLLTCIPLCCCPCDERKVTAQVPMQSQGKARAYAEYTEPPPPYRPSNLHHQQSGSESEQGAGVFDASANLRDGAVCPNTRVSTAASSAISMPVADISGDGAAPAAQACRTGPSQLPMEPLSSVVPVVKSMPSRQNHASHPGLEFEHHAFTVGDTVTLVGLVESPQNNGKIGVVMNLGSEEVVVKVEGVGDVRIMPQNLQKVQEVRHGAMLNGKRQWRATRTWPNGDKYDGEWQLDENHQPQCHGFGTHTLANGDVFEGMWREGVRSGRGTITWATGRKFSGQFSEDCPILGELSEDDGKVYRVTYGGGVRFSQGAQPLTRELIRTNTPAGKEHRIMPQNLREVQGLDQKFFRFELTFLEPALGLTLQNDNGARVVGFSRSGSGPLLGRTPGPAESSGRIKIGDRIVRVNGSNCSGLDATKVAILLRDAERPVLIIFERPVIEASALAGGTDAISQGPNEGVIHASAPSREGEAGPSKEAPTGEASLEPGESGQKKENLHNLGGQGLKELSEFGVENFSDLLSGKGMKKLSELGVENITDLLYLEDCDFVEVGMTIVDQRKVAKIRHKLLCQDGALGSPALPERPDSKTAHKQTLGNVAFDIPVTHRLGAEPIQEEQPSLDAARPGLVAQSHPPAQYNTVVAVGATTPNESMTISPPKQMVREIQDSPALGPPTKIEPEAHQAPPRCNPAREMHTSSETEAGTATIAGPKASAPSSPYSHGLKTREPPAIDAATIVGPELPADSAGSPRTSSASPQPDAGRGEPDESAAALPRERCDVCGKQASSMPGSTLFACSRCFSVFYCSASCQQKHWPLHREHCHAV